MSSGGPKEDFRGFSANFFHFGPIFAYFECDIPLQSAGVRLFQQVRLFGTIQYEIASAK